MSSIHQVNLALFIPWEADKDTILVSRANCANVALAVRLIKVADLVGINGWQVGALQVGWQVAVLISELLHELICLLDHSHADGNLSKEEAARCGPWRAGIFVALGCPVERRHLGLQLLVAVVNWVHAKAFLVQVSAIAIDLHLCHLQAQATLQAVCDDLRLR